MFQPTCINNNVKSQVFKTTHPGSKDDLRYKIRERQRNRCPSPGYSPVTIRYDLTAGLREPEFYQSAKVSKNSDGHNRETVPSVPRRTGHKIKGGGKRKKALDSPKKISKKRPPSSSSTDEEELIERLTTIRKNLKALDQDRLDFEFELNEKGRQGRRSKKSKVDQKVVVNNSLVEKKKKKKASKLVLAKSHFKPKQELVTKLPPAGYCKCKICKSYFPDNVDSRKLHLSQHPDRVFRVSLPSDSYYYDVEDAITYLVAHLGIQKHEIYEKNKKNKLIVNPTNLRGFSCDLCEVLDTNNEETFMRHMKEECRIKEKLERQKHLISFCRGCQGKFEDKKDLELHVAAGGCWPDNSIISRLYESANDNKNAAEPCPDVSLLNLKLERPDAENEIQTKKEIIKALEDHEVPQVQENHASTGPDVPSNDSLNVVAPSPVSSHNFDISNIAMEQLYINSMLNLQPHLFPSYFSSLYGLQPQDPSVLNIPGTSSGSFEAPSPDTFESNTEDGLCWEEPSPQFSPHRPSFQTFNSRSSFVSMEDDDKLCEMNPVRTSNRSIAEAAVDFILEHCITVAVAMDACAKLTCLWTDPHVDTCQKKLVQDNCAIGGCFKSDLHVLSCNKLSFYCDGKKIGVNQYRWNKEIQDIPLFVPAGIADRTCQENPTVVMRLIYKRTSKELQDPRLAQRVYPTVDPEPGRYLTIRARRAKGWSKNQTICTWSGSSSVTISNKPNHHLEEIDNDHDSDIEIVESLL